MSVSTDAILFFGYCWSDENDKLFDDDDDIEWQERVLVKRGHKDPWDDYPTAEIDKLDWGQRRVAGDAWVEKNRAEIDEWHRKTSAVEDEFGVGVGSHCSGDYPIPYVYAVETRVLAQRGYPVVVESIPSTEGLTENLDRFLAELGIEKPQDRPQWWLVSMWS